MVVLATEPATLLQIRWKGRLIALGEVEKVARGLKISHPDLLVDSDERLLGKFH